LTLKEYILQDEFVLNGPVTFSLEPGKACRIDTGNSIQELNLLLAGNLTAYVVNDNIAEKYVNAQNSNIEENITISGGKIIFVNRGNKNASFRITRTGYPETTINTVSEKKQFEEIMDSGGSMIFNIISSGEYGYSPDSEGLIEPGMNGYVLCVAGNITDAVLYTSDGDMYRGTRNFYSAGYKEQRPYVILPPEDGTLEVAYNSGYLKVWLSSIRNADTNFLESSFSVRNSQIENGIGALNGNAQSWKIVMNRTGFINVETGQPGITAFLRGEEIISIAAGTEGRKILVYAEEGAYKIITRPFSGSGQSGSIIVNKIEIQELEDRIYFIGPDETQAFRFTVMETGMVGIGTETEMDILNCSLYDAGSNLLGSGRLIFKTLDAGEYYFTVQSDDKPVQYKPVVLGEEGSMTEIPGDVIDQYK
jgi:hypothetical protein